MTLVDVPSVLPMESSDFERSLEQVGVRATSVPVELEKLSQPDLVPVDFLPFVASGLSVDVWPRRWNESQKRLALSSAIPLHKLKGSPAAVTEYVRQAGGTVKKFIRPPGDAFAGKSFRGEEKAAWLAHYPQLRIYPYRGHVDRPWQLFTKSGHVGVPDGPARRFAMPSTAGPRAGRRATLYDRGVETELNVTVTSKLLNQEVLVEQEAVHLKTFKPFCLAANFGLHRKRFAGSASDNSNTVRLTPSEAYGAIKLRRVRQVVSPGLIPIDPTPIEVSTSSDLPGDKFFAGAGKRRFVKSRSFVYPSKAFLHIYDVVYLYRPGVNIAPRRGRFFTNVSRLGVPDYTSEVRIRVRKNSGIKKLYGGGFVRYAHAYPRDNELVEDVLRSIRSAKSLRDQIDVNLNCLDVIRASSRLVAGDDVVCGSQMETI